MCVLWPASASAQLPSPKSTAIVPGATIGGVGPGMSIKRAIAVWGPGSTCTADSVRVRCTWMGTGKQGSAFVEVDAAGKVRQVVIEAAATANGTPVFSGPLLHWKARSKVRLGFTTDKILKVYPKLVGSPSGAALGSGTHTTTFTTSGGRVYQIVIGPI